MGSDVIYYEYEKREKFKDYDLKVDAELGTFKIRRYHFDGESFVHPFHSVRFHPDRPYEVPVEALMADQPLSSSRDVKSSTRKSRSSRYPTPHYSPRGMLSTQRVLSSSSTKGTSSSRRRVAEDEEDKGIGRMEPSIEKKKASEGDEEEEEAPEEEDPEEEVSACISLPMDIDVMRTTCSSLRSWSAVLSILPFVVVTLQCWILSRTQQIDSLAVIILRVMISLEFGNRHHWV
ncbi:hypothetical protein PIB30_048563 [Stylosanthes scabra]|uniref:Uncharacterized protein n=1 Tax=Stylosanthes scabra TaxID=79078 RepID=A0ABU6UJ08_9FABA|nr:hypothetical protein [Stylosanthes scabra]